MKKLIVVIAILIGGLALTAPHAEAANRANCEKYVPLMKKYHLPVSTFKNLAWRESGCNAASFVVTCVKTVPVRSPKGCDPDDSGGGLLGINLRGKLATQWHRLCGITLKTVTNAAKNIECAAKAYSILGLRPWVLRR